MRRRRRKNLTTRRRTKTRTRPDNKNKDDKMNEKRETNPGITKTRQNKDENTK